METTTRPPSPQPTGAPRWVALFHRPSSASWQVCAESPYRAPVQYALGEMAHTVRARGGDFAVSLWGPKDGAWQRFDVSTATANAANTTDAANAVNAATPEPPSAGPEEPRTLTERMSGRRQQVLMAGLGKAGLHDLAPDDYAAVQALVEQLDETTVRKVAQWLTAAGGQ
ncbi:hypothetical protein GCM10022403_038500 [Streptomyces coacervatus]|uniref:Uncharacterized protein n=1 Tax=Streptomyces coacervatus TaxID=647381 RepID=A0ABP7HRY9_9ACTN|nr:hypothetical protein [Streptomyces coacervatus]MDF2270740.1 hypothetical protein [Streptomyces coacervatus]